MGAFRADLHAFLGVAARFAARGGQRGPVAREMLEDLVAAAINDATHKVGVAVNEKMSGAMAGLQLPPGMKLPF